MKLHSEVLCALLIPGIIIVVVEAGQLLRTADAATGIALLRLLLLLLRLVLLLLLLLLVMILLQ